MRRSASSGCVRCRPTPASDGEARSSAAVSTISVRQPVAAAAVEAVGLRIFVDQPLQLLLLLVQSGRGQRRRQMAERDGRDAALGLRGLAGIATR